MLAPCAALILVGCAHLRPGDDGLSFPERSLRLSALPGWEMHGRIAVDTGEEAFQGRFSWRQAPEAVALSIRGPLGAGLVEVKGPLERLTVTARGETWTLGDPERDLSELVGWWVPVGSLSAWLIGLPDPPVVRSACAACS